MKTNIKLLNWRRKYKDYYVLKLYRVSLKEKEMMDVWLVNNCFSDNNMFHPWILMRSYIAFKDETDAMAFKLRWI